VALGLRALFLGVGRLLRLLLGSPLLSSSSSPLAETIVGGAYWYRLRGPVGSGLTSPCVLSCGRPLEGLLWPRSGQWLMCGPVGCPAGPWL